MTLNTCDLHDVHGAILEILPFGLNSYGGRKRFFREGRVLVVDAAGSARNAVLGDMIAGDIVRNGRAGIIIWGAVRDVGELAELVLGVLAMSHVPRPGKRRGGGQIGIEVRLGEARVSPGA